MMKLMLATVLSIASLGVSAEDLLVQSRESFLKQWKIVGTGLEHLEFSGRRNPLYGCVSVGIVVEADGSVSGPGRLLVYRFDRKLPARSGVPEMMAALAPRVIPKFEPIDTQAAPVASFTSWPIAFRSDKLEKLLQGRDTSRLDAALAEACEVDDLLERVQRKDGEPQELPTLPGLDAFAPPQVGPGS